MRPDEPSADDQSFGETGRPALTISDLTYSPADSSRLARVSLELTVNRDISRASGDCIAAAHEALDGGARHIDNSIQVVAGDHLTRLSGTRAYVTDNGYAVGVTAAIDDSGHGRTAPAATSEAKRQLTGWQQALLPELVHAVRQCLPDHEKDRANALARNLAEDIPSASHVIAAWDRVTLTEVIDRHEERMEAFARDLLPNDPDVRRDTADLQPALQAFSAVRLAQLSFPHHPAAALEQPHSIPPASAPPTLSAHRPGPSIDR
jgi:hypothetical protein